MLWLADSLAQLVSKCFRRRYGQIPVGNKVLVFRCSGQQLVNRPEEISEAHSISLQIRPGYPVIPIVAKWIEVKKVFIRPNPLHLGDAGRVRGPVIKIPGWTAWTRDNWVIWVTSIDCPPTCRVRELKLCNRCYPGLGFGFRAQFSGRGIEPDAVLILGSNTHDALRDSSFGDFRDCAQISLNAPDLPVRDYDALPESPRQSLKFAAPRKATHC